MYDCQARFFLTFSAFTTIPSRTMTAGTGTTKLVRGLGRLDATMIVVGSMIGSGIFITSAESSRLVGAPGWLLAAWALAGVLTITGALCCAELVPWAQACGQYVFPAELGPSIDFLVALFLVLPTGTLRRSRAFANSGVLTDHVSADKFLFAPRVFGGTRLVCRLTLVANRNDSVLTATTSWPENCKDPKPLVH